MIQLKKSYIFRKHAYPLTVGTIELTNAEATEIETLSTWRYQHFEAFWRKLLILTY